MSGRFSNRGGLKALAEITLADAVTIFPIKLVEGKHGLYLKMPRSTKDTDKDQLTYNITNGLLNFKTALEQLNGEKMGTDEWEEG